MKPATGATPLIALACVAVDTETTGLDTAEARIVELGAVAVASAAVRHADRHESFVDPGIAIPGASTAVHGITNAMVRNAPGFAEAKRGLDRFVAGRVVIGYSLGFDFAVMARECERAGIAWQKPRALCVRLLAAWLNPPLPDHSLETLAAWLGVEVDTRHRAAADAAIAAEVFVAMLPKLQERGVRTLAEAERASLSRTGELDGHQRAGWAEPVSRPAEVRPALGAVDPYAYRHRVADLMSAPPVVVASSARLKSVVRLMVEKRISSVFVSERGQPGRAVADYGIVTERDVMRRIASEGVLALEEVVDMLATRPLASIRAEAFVYRAIGRMDRLKIRHLAVRDEAGALAGIVSARDLLRLRAGAAIRLDDAILAAATPAEMAAAWATLPAVAERLVGEGIDGRAIAEIVSEELRAVTRRAAELAEQEMDVEGLGGPPCAYAVLVLGSGGRGESLLAADQDNAIVFSAGEPDGPEDRWFAELGRRMSAILDTAGVPFCKGGVMASNAAWRGSLDTWKARIGDWISRSRPQDLLNVDIFFDLAPVRGGPDLARELFVHAHGEAGRDVRFAKLLGEAAGEVADPFGFFGGLRDEDGRLDLKRHGLFPIVTMARTLAIRHGIQARSTPERLAGLKALDIGGDADLERLADDHAFLLGLMVAQQSRDLQSGLPATNRVELGALAPDRQARLKAVLRGVQRLPALTRDLMFG